MQMRNVRDQPSTGLDVCPGPWLAPKHNTLSRRLQQKDPYTPAYARQMSMVRVIRSFVMEYETRREGTP